MNIQRLLLLLSILMSGFCGIIAELSLFNLANTLIGSMNVVLTYTMGVMMFFMGVGALGVRLPIFRKHLLAGFVYIEAILSLLVGSSVFAILFLTGNFPQGGLAWILIYSASIGFLIGFEIPLIILINAKLKKPLAENSSAVLFADYLGSLLAFVIFSHFLLTHFGLAKSALAAAAINCGIAIITAISFSQEFRWNLIKIAGLIGVGISIAVGFFQAENWMHKAQQMLYRDRIVLNQQTPYQNLVLTANLGERNSKYNNKLKGIPKKWLFRRQVTDSLEMNLGEYKSRETQPDLRFFINGGLQFSTLDEHYYHESLIHPAMHILLNETPKPIHVLIGGGGDGLALRELLKYKEVEKVLVVDLDPHMTQLFSQEPLFLSLNDSSFLDPRVYILNTDFSTYIQQTEDRYDLVVLDFPDPHHDELGKLYSTEIYRLIKNSLSDSSLLVTQSTSPFYSRQAFLIIQNSLEHIFPGGVVPYKVSMPTFGLWGFHIASPVYSSQEMKSLLETFSPKVQMTFLNREAVQASYRWDSFTFRGLAGAPINQTLKPTLVQAYQKFP